MVRAQNSTSLSFEKCNGREFCKKAMNLESVLRGGIKCDKRREK